MDNRYILKQSLMYNNWNDGNGWEGLVVVYSIWESSLEPNLEKY